MDAIPTWAEAAREAFRLAASADYLGQTRLGELVGKTQGAVSKRIAAGDLLWAENGEVLVVEAELQRIGKPISRHALRLDVYPREGCHAEQCPEHGGSESNPSSVGDDKASPAISSAGDASRSGLEGARS